jgi:hypothetical protein
MTRPCSHFLFVVWVLTLGLMVSASELTVRGFGYGGGMGMALFPEMTSVNAFLAENGLPPMATALVGAGGGGRGGLLPGPSIGGVGWGLWASSEGEDRRAEWVFGGGGLDLGAAVGGDDRSVLTLGVVLGGGASVLTFSMLPGGPVPHPTGIVPVPEPRELGLAVAFAKPYVSMAAQLLPWMGFELRLGYVVPLLAVPFGDTVGIPAAKPHPAGPTVSFGLVFGGIAPLNDEAGSARRDHDLITAVSTGELIVEPHGELQIENPLGDVLIVSYDATQPQTTSRVVAWHAERTASSGEMESLSVQASVSPERATLTTAGTGRVDYVVRVPSGLDLIVRSGTGTITVEDHQAMTLLLETGVGQIVARHAQAAALIASVGIGQISLQAVSAQSLIANVGLGDILLSLAPSTSARLTAKASLGEVSIDRFPGMIGGVRGFLGKTGTVTLGQGTDTIELTVGVGRIDVEMYLPVSSM